MERQLDLFASITPPPPRTFANAATTRSAAGVAIRPTAAKLRSKVLEFIQQQGAEGASDVEIQTGLDMAGNTERPRRRELQQGGHIVDSGQTRLTPSGRAAVVWVATPTGAADATASEPTEPPPF